MARWLRRGAAVATGAAIAYLWDPAQGRTRRAKARDQLGALLRRQRAETERQARYVKGQAEGAAARARGAGQLTPEDDVDVIHGVKQAFARLEFPTSDVTVEVVEGVARLRGQVETEEQKDAVVQEAARVPGVREVQSYLHLPGQPAPNKASALRAS